MIGAMTSQDTQPAAAPARRLRRRTTDRVIGGVASGLGDYFNVDPLLIRIGFVGLIIFGGAGLVLYLIAWLLMPAEGQDVSPVEALVRGIGLTPQRIGWIAVVVAAIVVVSNLSSPVGYPLDGSGYTYGYYGAPLGISAPVVFWAVVVVVAGYLVIRRREISPATAGMADGQDSPTGEGLIRRVGPTLARIATFVLAALALIFLINSWNLNIPGDGSLLWAVAVIVVGFFLIRRPDTAPAVSAVASAPAAITPPQTPAVQRPPSPLAWYVCAAVLIAVGLLALASQVANVEEVPGQFFGAALAILGIGLIIGAWWGRARILILLALLLAPIAVAASFMTAPLEGGIGAMRFTPANAVELRDEYRIMSGTLTLDLTSLSIASRPVHIAASVAAGQLVVIVPPDASVELRARVGAGKVTVFDYYDNDTILTNAGTSLDEHYVRRRNAGPTYILDLQGGIGDVFVTNSSVNW
jgi:phage shock protein PspC (stress-responsive transcriptional regulator)